ncbi:MAG: L-threonylcarbamoyladenylate synthase [Nitrospirota bacterium]
MAELRRVDPDHPDPAALAKAAGQLLRGGLVAFPTESFYGLGVLASSPDAVQRLFTVKQRPADQPILVVAADRDQVMTVVERIPLIAERLTVRFWPGPLTLVLPAKPAVPLVLTGGTGRLGVRVPGLALPRLLAAAAGGPITATSANYSGAPPPTTAEAVQAAMGGAIDLILDGGPTAGGLPSTVLDLCGEQPVLVREGRISVGQLQEICGALQKITK